MWRYYRKRNVWTYIKIDFHKKKYASLKAPTGRYGHAYSYAYTENAEELFYTREIYVRKFLYIYGGFSYDCHTACADIWRYEIPYTPINVPPPIDWNNYGNHWAELQEDLTYGPGKRWKTSMVTYQRKKGPLNDIDANYIYLFGGIQVINAQDIEQLSDEERLNTTSYIFMNDMWRFELYQNQWEEVEVFGISEITRMLYLWNGT